MPQLSEAEMKELAEQIVELSRSDTKEAAENIRKELTQMMEDGLEPHNQKVIDLEKQLDEKNAALDELMDKHKEEMRLIKAETGQLGVEMRPEGGPKDPMRVDYGGVFLSKELQGFLKEQFMSGMGSGNIQRIDTGDINTTNLGGQLSTETADRFIDLIISQQATLSRITTRRMLSPEARLDEILVATRQIAPAAESNPETTAFSVADGVSFRARTLNTVEVGWAEDITLSFLEDNIERQNAEAHISAVLARQFGTDLNDLLWAGTTDTYVAATGFTTVREGLGAKLRGLTDATADSDNNRPEVTTPTTGTVSALFRLMHKAIKQRYKARTDWVFFCPTGTAERYADEVQQRETGLGDNVLVNGFPALRYFGRPVVPEPHLTGTNLDRVYLSAATAMVFGIHRNIRVDADFRPRKRAIEYTITARIGYQLAAPQVFVTLSADLGASFL